MTPKIFFVPLLMMVLFLTGSSAHAAENETVFVSVLPQRYFVQRIAGDTLNVQVMVEPGANPATYEPRPQQMAGLAKTRAYFSVGVPFEETWIPRFMAANPDLPVFSTEAGILRVPMKGHVHDETRENHVKRPDPHIWLSPRLVSLQARNILMGLTTVFPDKAPLFRQNYRTFLEEISKVDTLLLSIFSENLTKRQFLVLHPSWGYFAKDYGLEQVAIEVEGKAPRQKELLSLLATGRKEGWKTIFVQPQFSKKAAMTLGRDLGASLVSLDPLAENWSDNLLKSGKLIREALE